MKRTLRYKTVKASQTAKEGKDLLKSTTPELPTEQVLVESYGIHLQVNPVWYQRAFDYLTDTIRQCFYW